MLSKFVQYRQFLQFRLKIGYFRNSCNVWNTPLHKLGPPFDHLEVSRLQKHSRNCCFHSAVRVLHCQPQMSRYTGWISSLKVVVVQSSSPRRWWPGLCWSADVLSGRHLVRMTFCQHPGLDVLSGRHFVRPYFWDVLSGRHFVREFLCNIFSKWPALDVLSGRQIVRICGTIKSS